MGLALMVLTWSTAGSARQAGPKASPQGASTTNSTTAAAPRPGGSGSPSQGRMGPPPGPGQFGGRGGPNGEPYKWWKDEEIKKEIGLTDTKIAQIDAMWERRVRDMAPFVEAYTKDRDKLDEMIRAGVEDDSIVALQISRMETSYVKIDESKLLMYYRMYRRLDAGQYDKLKAYWAKQRAEREARGRGRGPAPSQR